MKLKAILFTMSFVMLAPAVLFAAENGPLRYQSIIDRLNCGPQQMAPAELEAVLSRVKLEMGADATELDAVLKVGTCVQSVLPSLELPRGLRLTVYRDHVKALTFLGSLEVSLPFNYWKGADKHIRFSDFLSIAGLVHEWTHPFFNEFMWPGYNQVNVYSLPNQLPDAHQTRHYNELFSDIVAVVLSGDPTAMFRIEPALGRDFTGGNPLYNWNVLGSLFKDDVEPHVYNYFDPVKRYVWRRVLRNLKSPQQRADALTKIAHILRSEAEHLVALHSRQQFMGHKEANQHLIKLIDQVFPKTAGVRND